MLLLLLFIHREKLEKEAKRGAAESERFDLGYLACEPQNGRKRD